MTAYKEEAICIRLNDWSESSQVVTFYSPNLGKFTALAKGSKRTSPSAVARYSGGVELLTYGQACGALSKIGNMARLSEWDLQDAYYHFRKDLDAYYLGLYLLDLTNAMTAVDQPDPLIFQGLKYALKNLSDKTKHWPLVLKYQHLIIQCCGYKPVFDRDIITEQPLDDAPAYTFSAQGGGVTSQPIDETGWEGHPTHQRVLVQGHWRVRKETITLLDNLPQISLTELSQHPSLRKANKLLCVYVRALLDKQLPTMRYILGQ